MALTAQTVGPVNSTETAMEQAQEAIDEVESYENAHGGHYSKHMMMKLIRAAKAMKRVRDETAEPISTTASTLLEDLKTRVHTDASHDCEQGMPGGCAMCQGIAEVNQGEDVCLD